MRTVPMASKKLFMTGPLGRLDASDVRPTDGVAQVMPLEPVTALTPALL